MSQGASPSAADMSAIARAFTDARRAARATPVYPGAAPATLADAYAIQDQAIGLWPDRIAGWKLGRIPTTQADRFGAGRLAGPIFARNVWAASATPVRFGIIAGGFAAVEAEYVLELGEDAPDRDNWTADEAARLVGAAHVGVEIAGSPFAGINDHGPAVTASDFGNNTGLIVGAAIADWRDRLADLSCEMRIEGRVVGSGGTASIPGGPFESLAFLLNVLHVRGRRLTAGQLISTGAATGVHVIDEGQAAVADFGPEGEIACVAVRAEGAEP